MKRPGGMKRNMITLHIASEQELYASYLPFLKHGGLFIKTDKKYQLGDEVFLLLTLLQEDKTPVAGKVVWINPKGTAGNRPQGIAVHFGELDNGKTRNKIEQLLAQLLRSEKPTYTM
ncbi:PilZ domain-containing protein [Candidatus Albibeggiatoa sp. nov. NOAA]|uniref:PilZ domain-containing protein n=1 Tax=Candidatus Albibeggiatoa sp. nov. NOAA TaxID=3162724 RepID=UPI0032FD566E|nr:PilZ domain-containing protein [Thiotrichaceae bacterium]